MSCTPSRFAGAGTDREGRNEGDYLRYTILYLFDQPDLILQSVSSINGLGESIYVFDPVKFRNNYSYIYWHTSRRFNYLVGCVALLQKGRARTDFGC